MECKGGIMNNLSIAFNNVKTSDSAVNATLRNTYFLLSLCLLACSGSVYLSLLLLAPAPGFLTQIIGMFGLLFLVHKTAHSAAGIFVAMLFSAFMGYTLTPIIAHTLNMAAGPTILFTSLSTTGFVFMALSAYVLQTRQDFSFMTGMTLMGFLVTFGLILLSAFLPTTILTLAISGMIAMLSSASILLHTSMIINGGERNYILATISLFISLYNLFVSILQIMMMFNSRD